LAEIKAREADAAAERQFRGAFLRRHPAPIDRDLDEALRGAREIGAARRADEAARRADEMAKLAAIARDVDALRRDVSSFESGAKPLKRSAPTWIAASIASSAKPGSRSAGRLRRLPT
jgi:hypothetical protein